MRGRKGRLRGRQHEPAAEAGGARIDAADGRGRVMGVGVSK